jgi:hypothetical protein
MEDSIKSETNTRGNKRGMNAASQKNLKPGRGRPPNKLSITTQQRKMLDKPCPYSPDMTWCEYLAERGLAMSAENASYYKELMDRLEGKVKDQVELTAKVEIKEVEVRLKE